jgi:hypothetical protein
MSARATHGATRKLATDRKQELIKIRVTSDQKATLVAAAERAGLDVSAWLRSLGLQSGRRGERRS